MHKALKNHIIYNWVLHECGKCRIKMEKKKMQYFLPIYMDSKLFTQLYASETKPRTEFYQGDQINCSTVRWKVFYLYENNIY